MSALDDAQKRILRIREILDEEAQPVPSVAMTLSDYCTELVGHLRWLCESNSLLEVLEKQQAVNVRLARALEAIQSQAAQALRREGE